MLGENDLAELARRWSPPEELQSSPPRPVRLSASGITVVLLTIGMVVGGIVLGIKTGERFTSETENRRLLEEQGREAEGSIIRLWVTSDKNRTHKVSYRFSTGQQVIDGQANAPRRIWEGLSEGSPLRIRYATSDPKINHPVGWDKDIPPQWIAWMLPVTFSAVTLFLIWSLRRQKRLLEDGRAAPGVITKVRRVKGGLRVRYDFLLQGGMKEQGSGMARRGRPEVGELVTVIYDPDEPKRNAPYPFDMVRPVEER